MLVAKIIKKFISYFLSFMCVLSCVVSVFDAKVHAADSEYEAHVAIFCDDTVLAEKYVKLLCSYEYDGSRRVLGKLGSGKSTEKVVITDGFGSRKYNIFFHIVDSSMALHPNSELNDLIRYCTGAIILYDFLDPNLKPMIKSRTFYKEDIESFLSIDTPLNNSIKYLQSFGRNGWWNALNFIRYSHEENITPEIQGEYRSQLNLYTGGVEEFYVDGDNKWSRNHPIWNSENGINNVFGWISGQAYKSIFMEKSLTGAQLLDLKKCRNNAISNKRIYFQTAFGTLAVAVIAAGCAAICKLKSNLKNKSNLK